MTVVNLFTFLEYFVILLLQHRRKEKNTAKEGMEMKSKLILTGAIIALLLLLCACSPASQASVEVSCDDLMNVDHVTRQVEVPVDGTLTVTLCSNPTTGFQWSEKAEIDDQTIVKQTEHEYVAPKQTGVVGAGGKEVWTFKALLKGTTEVAMEYSQPWAGGEKGAWTFKLTVVVK